MMAQLLTYSPEQPISFLHEYVTAGKIFQNKVSSQDIMSQTLITRVTFYVTKASEGIN